MKRFFYCLTLGMRLVASCGKNPDDKGGKSSADAFKGAMPVFVNGPSAAWETGDKVAVFSGGQKYELAAASSGSSVSFSGEVPSDDQYLAITPASAAVEASVDAIVANIPAAQTAISGGISSNAAVAVCVSSSADLQFVNAVGLVKVTLVSDNNIRSITVSSNGSERLAGEVSLRAATGRATVRDGVSSVVLSAASGYLGKGSFYIAVIPATYLDGLTIKVTDEFGRVSNTTTGDFMAVSAGNVLDLGEIDKSIAFTTPILAGSPYDIGFAGDGESCYTTVPASFTSGEAISKPDWVSGVELSGNRITLTASANPDALNARYGRVSIEGETTEGPARVEIPVAQAAAGMKIFYDSFTGPELASDWKGNTVRSNLKYGDGQLALSGSGDRTDSWPIFWHGTKVRLVTDSGTYNKWICTIDCASGSPGLWCFNKHGYEGNTYDFTSDQCWCVFMPFNVNSGTGGFYSFPIAGVNAQDNWDPIHEGEKLPSWMRLELCNIDHNPERAEDEILKRGDGYVYTIENRWAAAHVYALNEEDGIMIKDHLIWARALWWQEDKPQLDNTYRYFGVFAKDAASTRFRNFTLQYTDN